MICSVYKSNKKIDYYLFVDQAEKFERVPETLLNMLGNLEFVMDVDLDKREKLSQVDPKEVKQLIGDQGYFLQMPESHYRSGAT